jgi:predicted RNase H-like HicB family nuclease
MKAQTKQRPRKSLSNEAKYEIILYWSKDDEAFIAVVPELPGCMADGTTYQDAVANVEVVIREWIETAKDLGRSIPESRGRLKYA